MNRTRSRSYPHIGSYNSREYYYPWRTIHETRVSSRVTNVAHFKHIPITGNVWSDRSDFYNSFVTTDADFLETLTLARQHLGLSVSIPWHKLPTSNQFNSLALLAELRESIGMFSIRTVQQILRNPKGVWGFLEFGFQPFIADLIAILDLIECFRQMPVSVLPFSTSYTQSFNISNVRIGSYYTYAVGTSSIRLSGEIKRDLTSLPQLADVIGFKPDLATLWELTPLSFVLDYFLPIGDYLDNIMRSGWTSSIQFKGYISEKTNLSYNRSSHSTLSSLCSTLYYNRSFVETTVPVTKLDKPVDIDAPSLKQLFNTAYLVASSANPRKRIGPDLRLQRLLF